MIEVWVNCSRASRGRTPKGLFLHGPADKFDDLLLGPTAIVAWIDVAKPDECTVSAVGRFDVGDVGIAQNTFARLGTHANERIVSGVNYKRRDGDAVYYVRGGRASIVIVGSRESAVVGGDPVIKLPQASHPAQAGQIEEAGEMPGLPPRAAEKLQ